MTTTTLPALFLSHGSPMFALEPGDTGPVLQRWGQDLLQQHPGLRGVVVMSPHWMARGAKVMAHPQPDTWHDFGGFPEPLYRLRYPASGSPALARSVETLLTEAGLPVRPDPERPFDHGAWVPLMHLFPEAQVPVVQVALPAGAGPREVYAMGEALRPLADQGVLLVGSGSMTHNLREFFGGRPELGAEAAPYVTAFSRWVEDAVLAGDAERLFDYANQAPQAARAHPSDEHFLPLFFALGAAGWAGGKGVSQPPRIDYLSREVMYSYLAMDAIALHPTTPPTATPAPLNR